MKHSLALVGLSLTMAQSVSNLMNQRILDISRELVGINNASKTVNFEQDTYDVQIGKKLPTNVIDLIKEKAQLSASMAFLMENIKYKDAWMKEWKLQSRPALTIDMPAYPTLVQYKNLPFVDEQWGWDQLSIAEYDEYLEQEAMASHIGQFIHKNGVLDVLRKELPSIKTLEWVTLNQGTVNSIQRPVKVTIHHTPDELLNLHNKLAAEHRAYEQRVNYFKAKVKNMVSEQNTLIAQLNADAIASMNIQNKELELKYSQEMSIYNGEDLKASQEFEKKRSEQINTIAKMRIQVDPRFKETIDKYAKLLEVEE